MGQQEAVTSAALAQYRKEQRANGKFPLLGPFGRERDMAFDALELELELVRPSLAHLVKISGAAGQILPGSQEPTGGAAGARVLRPGMGRRGSVRGFSVALLQHRKALKGSKEAWRSSAHIPQNSSRSLSDCLHASLACAAAQAGQAGQAAAMYRQSQRLAALPHRSSAVRA